jgi:hypothetical protein
LLLLPLLLLVLFSGSAPAAEPSHQQLYQLTRDTALIKAVQALWRSGEIDCVNALIARPVRLVLKPLQTLDPMLKNYDAVSWISPDGQQYVFVNQKHQYAPPAALAALIGHEMLHDDEANSVQEEIFSWTMEAHLWHQLKQFYPQAAKQIHAPLVQRLNTLEADWQAGILANRVRKNPGYKALPETSVGFGGQPSDPAPVPAALDVHPDTSDKVHRLRKSLARWVPVR